jgi:uncharacterized protein (TIGR03437 family)
LEAPADVHSPIVVIIGSQNATVLGAALVVPGEFQINIAVPSLAPGIYPVTISVSGQSSQSGVVVPIAE